MLNTSQIYTLNTKKYIYNVIKKGSNKPESNTNPE